MLDNPDLSADAKRSALDVIYGLLVHHIFQAVAAVIPCKTVGPSSRSWWDEELQDLVNIRTKAYSDLKAYCDTASDVPLGTDATYNLLWNKYVQLRRNVHLTANRKKSLQQQILLSRLETEFVQDRRHFFREIVKIRRKRSKSRSCSLQSLRDSTGSVTNDPIKIKQILFDLHSGAGKNDPEAPHFDKVHYQHISSLMSAVSESEDGPAFCETRISLDEIKAALSKAQNQKACGLDQIHNEPLKHGGNALASSLHLLFNAMLKAGVCPSIWAKALVHLAYKGKGIDPLDARSYRPISLTSCISKVFERALLNRLEESFEDNHVLEEEQAGFRTGRGCNDQTFLLREILESRKAAGLTTILCAIDLTNAFGSTWQDGMWYRLRQAGVRGKLYRVIKTMYRNCSSAL